MSLQAPAVPDFIRIAQSLLSDEELAYVCDLIKQSRSYGSGEDVVPGWSGAACIRLDSLFEAAARQRNIKDGVRVVTQTVDLRS